MALWLRWSVRDLRRRWVQVVAIAFIVALGSGVYAGLSSTSTWRRVSYDESFERARMYDLRVQLSPGSYVPAAELADAVRGIPHAGALAAVSSRLVVPVQVDASTPGRTILVPGRLVGADARAGTGVNRVVTTAGRPLAAADAGHDRAVLDLHFAKHYDLPPTGSIRVGDRRFRYVGLGLAPEYFMVVGERGNILAEANFAVAFVPLETAQQVAGQPGAANDAVLRLRPGTDPAVIRRELAASLAEQFPGVGITINGRRGDIGYRTLYDDIEGDQRFYNIFAVLILAGAAFAAFNLAGRIVEAQRREIGIGMALGVRRRELAIRPLLVGAEIGLAGIAFGIGVGLVVGLLMQSVQRDFFPLPVWRAPFQPGVYARAAAIGLALPVVAAAYPVWRAVRVTPVDAIRTGFLAAKGGGWAPWLRRIPLPGRTTSQIPFRNVLRTPRRSVMTLLGVSVAIVVLIGVVGMVDSFLATIDRGEAELTDTSPRRLVVSLDSFYPDTTPAVTAIGQSRLVQRAEPILQVPGRVVHDGEAVDVFVDVVDFRSRIWRPTVERPHRSERPGIVLSETAAADLGVEPGDEIVLRHPRRTGPLSYEYVRSPVVVAGVNPLPLRAAAFMDQDDARIMNLDGITNAVIVDPAAGVGTSRLQRALFGAPSVASAQPVRAYTQSIRDELQSALGILTIVEGAVLLLALLIAFNSASINADERRREEATMFAFGLPVRTVLRMTTVESLVIGVLGTALGLGVGWLLLDWLITRLLPQTFPDLGIVTAVSPSTWLTAVLLGILAVTVAPLFTVRKLRRMDIPSTLRVME